jgi:hypothetical protein
LANRACSFSKIRGTDGMHVGRTSAQSGTMADGPPLQYATTPPTLEMLSCTTWAKTCAKGRDRYATSSAPTTSSSSVTRQQAVVLR